MLGKTTIHLGEILNKKRAIEILYALYENPNQHIRSLQRKLGGSLSTIVDRVNFLVNSNLVKESKSSGREGSLELTDYGMAVVSVIDWLGMSSANVESTLDSRKKWILALLHVLREIKGSTRLEKLLFLLKEQFRITDESFYEFNPYLFGPFSKEILEDANDLHFMDYINVSLENVKAPSQLSDAIFIRKTYRLTECGKEEAEKCYKEIVRDERVAEAIYRLVEYNSMPLSHLLNYVYTNFPFYSPPNDMP